MIRSELEKIEIQSSQSLKTEEASSLQKSARSMPVMDVVDRLRLNLFKIERIQTKLSLALSEVSQITKK